MNENMSHRDYCSPIGLWMLVFKVYCKHIGGLSYNLNIFYKRIIEHIFLVQIIQFFTRNELNTIINSSYYML